MAIIKKINKNKIELFYFIFSSNIKVNIKLREKIKLRFIQYYQFILCHTLILRIVTELIKLNRYNI